MLNCRRRRAPLAVLLLSLTLALGTLPATAAPAERPGPARVTLEPGDPLLAAPARGRAAVRQLGSRLATASQRNDMRSGELRQLLLRDRTAWLDTRGRLFYIDPSRSAEGAPGHLSRTPRSAAALSDTFRLHSKPGANRTILLDFDGGEVSGSAWNDEDGVPAGPHPAWDPASDGPAFSAGEQGLIQQIWAMVAEDYAPFDVDVTTEDTGPATIVRESTADSLYGTRVLITPSDVPFTMICDQQCGGVAYVSTFDEIGDYYQPAWVFPQALGDDPKNIADTASHEAGHNLGLDHDGTLADSYYGGHGPWAPIMGFGFDRPVVQWSQGSYLGADNAQDDVAILRGYLGSRSDEAAASPAEPSALPPGEAFIGTRGDVDAFLLGRCAPGTVVAADPASIAPNLDIRLELYDAAGTLRESSEPATTRDSRTVAGGLGASVSVPSVPPGSADGDDWVITVQGVGHGGWLDEGYDDYGSLGAYRLTVTGCDGQTGTGAPGAPANLRTTGVAATSVTLNWDAPDAIGTSPVTGYVVTRSGAPSGVNLPANARSHTFTGLAPETEYEFSVRAVNSTGAGPTATTSATTSPPAPAAPSAPLDLTGHYEPGSDTLRASWTPPASSGSAPVETYSVHLDGEELGTLDAENLSAVISMEGGFSEGSYEVGVAATNSVGSSPLALTTIVVDLPDPPANDDVASAQPISGLSGFVDGDNAHATAEATDPPPPSDRDAGGFSTWYSWRPSGAGDTIISTSGGGAMRDTTLAVYTGGPGTWRQVAGDDDTGDGSHARVDFRARSGVRYLIAVDGFAGRTEGTGPYRLTWSQSVQSAPSAPRRVKARPGNAQASVSWLAPAVGAGSVTSYVVRANPGGRRCVTSGARTCRVTQLRNGTRYRFTVTAVSEAGRSAASAPSAPVTPAGKPKAPRIGRALSGKAGSPLNATAAWRAARANGSPIRGYRVRAYRVTRRGGLRLVKTSPLLRTSARRHVMALKAGRYRFRVSATNARGAGPSSRVSNVVIAR